MYALVSLWFYADENIYVLLIAHKLIYILWRWRYVRSTNGPRRHCFTPSAPAHVRRVAYANRSLATDTDSGSDIKAYNLTLS